MKEYKIPITWLSCKVYTVSSDNLQEALEEAFSRFFSEPDDNYLEDSFDVDAVGLEEDYPNEEYDVDKAVNNL